MTHPFHTDIIIIGAGIAGAGLAAMVSPFKKAVILEAEDTPGYHSTGRSAAVFIQNYGNQTIRQLSRLSRPYLENPPSQLCSHSLLHQRGCLFVDTEKDSEYLAELMDNAEGLVPLSQKEALQRVPILRPDTVYRAAYEAGTADIDVAALHQGWLKLAKQQGTQCLVNNRVKSIEKKDPLWHIETNQGEYIAPVIVNAAGAWADAIALMANVKPMGITPKRRTMAVLPANGHYDVSQWPMFGNINDAWYAKPETGRLLVSPADHDPVPPQDIAVDDMILAEGLYRFEQAVNFPVTRLEHQWAGLRCFAPDDTPVVGFAPDSEGFFWLAGQGGYGIQTAPALSALASSLVTQGAPDTCYPKDLIAHLSPARFFHP